MLCSFRERRLPLHIFEDRYKQMVAGCLERKEPFGVVRAREEGLAVIGCTAAIVTVLQRYSDGRVDILCEGGERFEIEMLDNSRAYLQAEVDTFRRRRTRRQPREREQCLALHLEVTELAGGDANPAALQLDLDQPISLMLAWMLPVDLDFKAGTAGLPIGRGTHCEASGLLQRGSAQTAARGAGLEGRGAQRPRDVVPWLPPHFEGLGRGWGFC